MPSNLANFRNERQRFFQRRERDRLKQFLQDAPFNPPFGGYTPDVNVNHLDLTGASVLENLRARTLLITGSGRALTHDDGYARLDSANLPLAGSRAVVNLSQFREDAGSTQIAINAGVETTTECTFYRFPSSTWTIIAPQATTPINAPGGAFPTEPSGNRTRLWDWTSFQDGATARGHAAPNTALTVPIWIGCNGHDPTIVYPDQDAGTAYDHLIRTDVGASPGFIAKSCTTFADRVVFLNTQESGNTFDRRLRRTPVGDANPLSSLVGSGTIDFVEFRREGLRVLPIGDLLACYFRDGVALVGRTGIAVAPFRKRHVSHTRGLLGTFAVTPIGANEHFGIFTDGWFKFDSAGRFTEIGTAVVGGLRVRKWKDTFFELLDRDNVDQIVLDYDEFNNGVRISFPTEAVTENPVTWFLDLASETVWPQTYGVTYWGRFDREISAGETWDDWATSGEDWDSKAASWDSYLPRSGSGVPVFGTSDGLVMGLSSQLSSRDGTQPTYRLFSHELPFRSAFDLKVATRFELEYMNILGTPVSIGATSNARTDNQSITRALNEGAAGSIQTAFATLRLPSTHLGVSVSGLAPVAIMGGRLRYLAGRGSDVAESTL